jgi:hypothetical protein
MMQKCSGTMQEIMMKSILNDDLYHIREGGQMLIKMYSAPIPLCVKDTNALWL